jgi:hypothetical protein
MSEELFNPWKQARPAPCAETVELASVGLSVPLRALDTLRTSRAMDEAQHLIAEHVAGEETTPFIGPDGEEYELNELIIKDLCLLRAMHAAERPFGFTWWLGLAVNCPEEYATISGAASRINTQQQKAAQGNSRAAARTTG